MKVYIASDHGGYEYKEELKRYLKDKGYVVEDMGAHELNQDDDYPDFVLPLAKKVALRRAQGENDFGIIFGRSGNGEAIAANKVKGIRAALCLNEKMSQKARTDNNANVLALGTDFVDAQKAEKIIEVFLDTPYPEEERHARRLKKISDYEIG